MKAKKLGLCYERSTTLQNLTLFLMAGGEGSEGGKGFIGFLIL
jgi:hypothetical protein